MAGRRRSPAFPTAYLCWCCGAQISWGEVVRIVRTDVGQPAYELRENYAHLACLRSVMRDAVPLAFARHWHFRDPVPDDSDETGDSACVICGEPIAAPERTCLRLQRPTGTTRAPEFDEESVAVHRRCLDSAAGTIR